MIDLPAYEKGVLVEPDGAGKPYVMLGDGPDRLVIIPGSADGLRTSVDVAPYLAWFYRERARKYRLLILSRRDPIPVDYGIERHADDMLRTVEALGWGPAIWECISAGGPIGQWAAVKRPDLVRGLILSSSPHHAVGRTRATLQSWLAMAEQSQGADFMWSMFERKYRPPDEVLPAGANPVEALAAAAHDPERLPRLLRELLKLDQRDLLPRVTCPVLVVSGEKDRVVPTESQREMAALLPQSRLTVCPGFGHFHDMENPAYHQYVDEFVEALHGAG